MKKYLLTLAIISSSITFSQVVFGDEKGSTTNKTSVLLDFALNQNKGIILPYNTTLPASQLAEGTIVLDASDPTKAKVKYYNGAWQDLSSGNEANITSIIDNQPTIDDKNTQGVIIGAESSNVNGILILESQDKAMILPQVTNTDDIISPAPGMMVYLNKTNAKRLAVFNGSKWTYWAPKDI